MTSSRWYVYSLLIHKTENVCISVEYGQNSLQATNLCFRLYHYHYLDVIISKGGFSLKNMPKICVLNLSRKDRYHKKENYGQNLNIMRLSGETSKIIKLQ